MACNNTATLIRYVAQVKLACDNNPAIPTPFGLNAEWRTVNTIVKVGGLNLGEEGTVTVPEWGRVVTMSDGVRTFQPLTIQARMTFDSLTAGADFKLLADMFDVRASKLYDWSVAVTTRDFSPILYLHFYQCEMRKFTFEDQELGQAKPGLVDMEFLPKDVEMFGCNNTPVITTRTASSSFVRC